MARRHLGLSTAEWDGLAWWEQRLYIDGYYEEGLLGDPEQPDPSASGSGVQEHRSESVMNGQPGELTAFGFTEQTLG